MPFSEGIFIVFLACPSCIFHIVDFVHPLEEMQGILSTRDTILRAIATGVRAKSVDCCHISP
jgi:hypothetical protein